MPRQLQVIVAQSVRQLSLPISQLSIERSGFYFFNPVFSKGEIKLGRGGLSLPYLQAADCSAFSSGIQVFLSNFVKLCHYQHPQSLVKGTTNTQSLFVRAPV